MANGAEYEDPSNNLSALVNEPTAPPKSPTTAEAPSRVVEGEKGGKKKKKKDKKKKKAKDADKDADKEKGTVEYFSARN